MERRDFLKNTALAVAGASLISPLGALAEDKITHLESSDVSPSAIAAKDDYIMHFMALGDWGRNGEYDQQEVAKQMGIWGLEHANDFVISVGDNFYPKGVVSETDPLFHYSFENIYTAHSLQCDWYPILGNHDWLTDPDAQVRYSKISRRWDMPAKYYSKEIRLKGKSKVKFIFADTDPYLHEDKKEYAAKHTAWLKEELANRSADVKWTIVVGHHPYYTVGPRITNFDTLTMRKFIKPILDEAKVDVYLSGHEHSLQHHKDDGFTHQFISGAGSELTPVTTGVAFNKFAASEHGFMYFSIDEKRLNVKTVNMAGKLLYETELTK